MISPTPLRPSINILSEITPNVSTASNFAQTPTPSPKTGWVLPENDFVYTPAPPHKLNVSNISAVTDPIWVKL